MSGSCAHLFDNEALDELASKGQPSNHQEPSLKGWIRARFQIFLIWILFSNRRLCPKAFSSFASEIKQSRTEDFASSEPDSMVFKRRGGSQTCHIIKLEDGHVFDTGKASAVRQAVHGLIERNAQHIQYRSQAHSCAFNQDDKQFIWNRIRRRITRDEAITERELLALLASSYKAVVEARRMDGAKNAGFFLSNLVKIASIRCQLRDLLV